ncbi:RHS repeat domain-containing protein [Microtetraspora fusca]|uniref:RHS repeat domain-containing protein n=1 Tax=Microtetraspora fusca TaxID=1997 RepID=A0ABW6V2A8_MICFU
MAASRAWTGRYSWLRHGRRLAAAMVLFGVFLAGIGVPNGLLQQAAAETPSTKPDQSVEGRSVAAKSVPKGAEDASAPVKSVEPVWPKPGTAVVDVPAASDPVKVPGLPVSVAAVDATPKARSTPSSTSSSTPPEQSSPSRVRVETFDKEAVHRAGGIGVAVRLSRDDGGTVAAPMILSVDYSGFQDAYPADLATRLVLAEVPSCVLAAALTSECADRARSVQRVLHVSNDLKTGLLSAEVNASAPTTADDAGNASDMVYVLTTTAASSNPYTAISDFSATDLKPSGSWQSGTSGGDFTYSYPIKVPPAVGGDAPSLALSYSSSAVDSLTGYTNNQASWAGMGWDMSTAFIERRFRACSSDFQLGKHPLQGNLKDWCWESPDENDNKPSTNDMTNSQLTLSLEGKSSQIVKDTVSGTYKTVDEFGWKIEQISSGSESGQPYWRITTQDGTVYRFGFRRDASWQVPYMGDDPGEPCHDRYSSSAGPSGDKLPTNSNFCWAPWRWNLDQEVDTHSNAIDYYYTRELGNYCGAYCTGLGGSSYDRGGYLQRVEYGHNLAVTGSVPTARVVFNAVNRGTPPPGSSSWYNDTPDDLDCDLGRWCIKNSPAFYIEKRLDSIVTQTRNSSTWDDVTRLELGYKWVDSASLKPYGGKVNHLLWLDYIREVGLAGGGPGIVLPPVNFDAVLLDNRADYHRFLPGICEGRTCSDGDWTPRLSFPRIGAINNGLGGRTEVTYGQAKPCPTPWSGVPTTGWDTRAQDCYYNYIDSYTNSAGGTETVYAVYNKWLTTKVVEKDLVGGSPDRVTRYEYIGTPAWAKPFSYVDAVRTMCYDPFPILVSCIQLKEDWDQFRGYQSVRTITGSGTDPAGYSVTTTSYFRGMYDDVKADGTTRNTTVTDFEGGSYQDRRALAGRKLQEQTFRATAATASGPTAYEEIAGSRTEYALVASGNGPGIYDPVRVDDVRQVAREKVSSGWRYSETKTTYNADGLPIKVNDYGDRAVADDNTCTSTTYTRNAAKWMLNYVASEEQRAGDDCSSGQLLSRSLTLYDGSTDPASNTLTRGDVTQSRDYDSASTYVTTKATFDGYGRPLTATDPLGKTTSTTYTPAVGWPSGGITVTNPLGHTATTWASAAYGAIVGARDANGHDTNIDYDALGRAITLWTPAQPKSGDTPAAKVTYTLTFDGNLGQSTAPARIATSRLQSGSGANAKWVTTYSYDDGLGRARESQTTSPAGGRIVTATGYDARGLVSAVSAPVYNSAEAGSGLLNPAWTSLPQWSTTTFDGLGRPTAQVDMSLSAELRRTTTTYFGERTETQPPAGGKTVTYTDVNDLSTKVEQWLNGSTHYDTTYSYDASNRLIKTVDANGNARTFTYDLLGRKLTSHDPDAGDSQQSYDAAGRTTWSIDGNTQKISQTYDDLGRKTAQWAGEVGSGTKLAEWTYDTLAKGQLTSATRYTGGKAYTTRVTGYDVMGRPTGSTLSIPTVTGEEALAGDYTFTADYNTAGAQDRVGMPAAGGLPAEMVTSTFTDLGYGYGLTSDLAGGTTYVKSTSYSATGLLTGRSYGANEQVKRSLTWDTSTGRLTNVTTLAKADTTNPVTAQNDDFFYNVDDTINRILDKASAVSGGTAGQAECFTYDGLRRLSAGWTTTAASCGSGASSGDGQGIDPYAQSYTYDAVGNLSTLTNNGQTSTYRYPAAGPSSVRPNAVTSIQRPGGTDSYTYDNAGQMTGRTVAGKAATFQWDELGELTKATVDGSDTTMVYDADGNRLIRRDSTKTVLYLGSMELELAAGTITAKRYYTAPDGAVVAMRSNGSTGLTWLASGLHGSEQLAVSDATGQVSRQRYLPFGQRRGADNLPFTDRGFLGKIEDDSTGLDYLSARYYDPSIGKFISTDPLLALDNPQWANPYSYAGDNPIGLSDPTGLIPEDYGYGQNGGVKGWRKDVDAAKHHQKIKPHKTWAPAARGRQYGYCNAKCKQSIKNHKLDRMIADRRAAARHAEQDRARDLKELRAAQAKEAVQPAGILGEGEDVDAAVFQVGAAIATDGLAARAFAAGRAGAGGLPAYAESVRGETGATTPMFASEYTAPSGAKYYGATTKGGVDLSKAPATRRAVEETGHHGGCSEVACLAAAERAEGASAIQGGSMRTVRVRSRNSDRPSGTPGDPCVNFCQPLLQHLRITWGK